MNMRKKPKVEYTKILKLLEIELLWSLWRDLFRGGERLKARPAGTVRTPKEFADDNATAPRAFGNGDDHDGTVLREWLPQGQHRVLQAMRLRHAKCPK
ncbi:hypothetical protein AAFN86_16090 [Roseomonas sp. CAU 1739]|uniref:hypothetical protein n=1 Tax=Roseomonas sp. CAU 1739 TaxID=3140364 RepID=UPI00325A5983